MINIYPSREFWENDLEIPAADLLFQFQDSNVRENWLHSLSGKQLNVIFHHSIKDKQNEQLFNDHKLWKYDDISVQQKRKMLINISESLFIYYLISYFSRAKLDSVTIEVAKPVLNEDVIETFLLSDKKSILFTLFTIDPNLLKHVFHFNKVQKRSFSSFVLKMPPRQKPFFLQMIILKANFKISSIIKTAFICSYVVLAIQT